MVGILKRHFIFGSCANDVADPAPLPTLSDRDIKDLSKTEQVEQALLVKKRQRMLAVAFRDHMTTGQSFKDPNLHRQGFFNEIIVIATKVCFLGSLPFQRMTSGCLEVRERMCASINENRRPSCI
jgi:hypothetical protein